MPLVHVVNYNESEQSGLQLKQSHTALRSRSCPPRALHKEVAAM